MRTPTVTVRATKPGDGLELRWLASPARLPRSMTPGLLAECAGVPLAAIALTSGVVVDPRHPADDAVRFLKLVRYRVMRQGGHIGSARSLLHRGRSHMTINDTVGLLPPPARTVGVSGRVAVGRGTGWSGS